MSALGLAQRDARRESNVVGNFEQRAQLGLDHVMPHRERPAVAQRPRREQQVLARRIHRRAFVRTRVAMALETYQHHNWSLFKVVNVVLHRCGHARLRSAFGCAGSGGVAIVALLIGPPRTKRPTQ